MSWIAAVAPAVTFGLWVWQYRRANDLQDQLEDAHTALSSSREELRVLRAQAERARKARLQLQRRRVIDAIEDPTS